MKQIIDARPQRSETQILYFLIFFLSVIDPCATRANASGRKVVPIRQALGLGPWASRNRKKQRRVSQRELQQTEDRGPHEEKTNADVLASTELGCFWKLALLCDSICEALEFQVARLNKLCVAADGAIGRT